VNPAGGRRAGRERLVSVRPPRVTRRRWAALAARGNSEDCEPGVLMPIRIIQLGSARRRGEGVRIGTVRRPPRGVRKSQYAKHDWYDVWLPNLAPSATLMRATCIRPDGTGWRAFELRYRAEMKRPEQSHLLAVLAALSHTTNFSVGCYCADERHCHRSILRRLLQEHGAIVE
jgi:uncharacterized protein YeaO (DUF488 family)